MQWYRKTFNFIKTSIYTAVFIHTYNFYMVFHFRYKDRMRERGSKKRRDDSTTRRRREDDTDRSSASSISSAMTIITKFRGQREEEPKTRSSSLDTSSSLPNDPSDSTNTSAERRKSSAPYVLEKNGILTASLTIPVQTSLGNNSQPLALGLEDDIPFIEDDTRGNTLTRVPTAPARRRQRSASGSDSSAASLIQQPITGSISLVGYDSAVGSSITFSSPVQNTPSSLASSIADAGNYSSPPSWASTPPTSPDSAHTSVNYIPDDPSKVRTSSKAAPMLQKVSFTSSSDVKQMKPTETKRDTTWTSPASEQKFTPSITNIGNAVLRSKTADFERIAKTDVKKSSISSSAPSDKKKYTKRRYTDSRHQTRHIPDAESLETASSTSAKAESTGVTPVYKRRELISSVPSK